MNSFSGSNLGYRQQPWKMNNSLDWDTGVAITAASYQVGRDLDGTTVAFQRPYWGFFLSGVLMMLRLLR